MQILLSAGHYPERPGASYRGHTEHAEALLWQEILGNTLIEKGISTTFVPIGTLVEKVQYINSQDRVAAAIEIHFNAAVVDTAKGCETLHFPGSGKGYSLAGYIQDQLAGVFPPSRGVKEGWWRMDFPGQEDYPGDIEGDEVVDYFLRRTYCPSVIVEPEFIHNIETIKAKRREGCEGIAFGIKKWLDSQ